MKTGSKLNICRHRASEMIHQYTDGDQVEERCAARDLLTDLLHWCKYVKVSFKELLRGARQVQSEEEEEDRLEQKQDN